MGMLTWSDTCGKHVEGYVPPGGSDYVARRIRALGGELSTVDIDEAIWFGRFYGSANACHSSIDALAACVAANSDAYRRVFSDVQLSDTERLGPPSSGDRAGRWTRETPGMVRLGARVHRRALGLGARRHHRLEPSDGELSARRC
jgi:hypothetical protein